MKEMLEDTCIAYMRIGKKKKPMMKHTTIDELENLRNPTFCCENFARTFACPLRRQGRRLNPSLASGKFKNFNIFMLR